MAMFDIYGLFSRVRKSFNPRKDGYDVRNKKKKVPETFHPGCFIGMFAICNGSRNNPHIEG